MWNIAILGVGVPVAALVIALILKSLSRRREAIAQEQPVCISCSAASCETVTRSKTSEPTPADLPISPSRKKETAEEKRKREKDEWLRRCYEACRNQRESDRYVCRDTYDVWEEEDETPEFRACTARAEEKFKACCIQCREAADRRFGRG